MSTTILDSFDTLAHADVFEHRLTAAATDLAKRPGLTEEKAWLEAARRHVARARSGVGTLAKRALRLPELAAIARGERGRALQGAAVDAAEDLLAAIRTVGGERSPLLEVMYRNLKFANMRRCGREEFEKFCGEIEKRLASSYAERMLADPDYASVAPALATLREAFEDWRTVFSAKPLESAEQEALRAELESVAGALDRVCRQARLLAEAALLSAKEIVDTTSVLEKPKKRARPKGDNLENAQLSLDPPAEPETAATPTPPEAAEADDDESSD